MAEIEKINSSTPIKGFPDIYNKNNNELVELINSLQTEINALKANHDEDVKKLQSAFETWKTNHTNEFDTKMTEFEKSFVTRDDFEKDVKTIIDANK